MPSSDYSARVARARSFALQHHGDQKYGPYPYIYHLDQVAKSVRSYGEDAQCVAYLHDILEDTKIRPEDLSEWNDLLPTIMLLTSEGRNRVERNRNMLQKMSQTEDKMALLIKVADRLCNVLCCIADKRILSFSMYKAEQEEFQRAVRRAGLFHDFWITLDAAFCENI